MTTRPAPLPWLAIVLCAAGLFAASMGVRQSLPLFLGTLPLVGLDTWQAYLFGRVGDLAANPIFGVTALQTVASLLRQLFVYDPTYTPAPLLDAPVLATGLWLAAAAGLLGLTLASARRFPPLVAGAATLCLVVPTQPAGEQHHYVMLLTPLLLALILAAHHLRGAARDPRTLRTWPRRVMAPEARAVSAALALAAAALMLLPSNYFLDNAAWAGWPRAIFAYPRLYGALLLWAAWMFYGSDRGGRLRA